MKNIFVLFLLTGSFSLLAQSESIHTKLAEQYDNYRESTIVDRRFKHSDIVPLIQKTKQYEGFQTMEIGKSIENRSIYQIRLGSGPKKILLWSQMHGDEATATMAIMDIFNFLASKNDGFDDWRSRILAECTLFFIPMLNPDGAQRYERRNTQDIDLNRDALRAQTPEGKLLKTVVKEIQPDFGFNLHDQSRYYSAGNTPNPATISFLAPAFNYEKEINLVRKQSMQLIVEMNALLQTYIPDHVAKYSDDFEPRAFGDNIQKWGTSTILIEAGGLRGDLEKQEIRKLHFLMLLDAFDAIATERYINNSIDLYQQIPDNERKMKDFIIKETILEDKGRSFRADIAFKFREIEDETARYFYREAYIDDIGDLSVYYGYEEFSGNTYVLKAGKTYPTLFKSSKQLYNMDLLQLIREGYTDFVVQRLSRGDDRYRLAVCVHLEGETINNQVALGNNPSLVVERGGRAQHAIINGVVINLNKNERD